MFTTSQLLPITLVHYHSDHQPYSELSFVGQRLVITNVTTEIWTCIIKEHFWSKRKYLSMDKRERIEKHHSSDSTNTKA